MDYKRVALYVLWGFIALLLWNAWQQDYPPVVTKTAIQTKQQATNVNANTISTVPIQQKHTVKTAYQQDDLIQVKTNTLNVAIDKNTGKIINATLPQYPKTEKNKQEAFVLLNHNDETYYTATSGVTNLNHLHFTSNQNHYELTPGENKLIITLNASTPNLAVKKVYTFKRGSYAIGLRYDIKNHGKTPFQGRYFMRTTRKITEQASHLIGLRSFYGVATSSKQEPYDKHTFSDLKQNPIEQKIKGGWLAFIQHYFLTAWIPNKHSTFYYESQDLGNNTYSITLMGSPATIDHGESETFSSEFYVGPAIKTQLDQLAPHLSLTIDYGWLWMISIILFALLKFIFTFVGNWGVAIILLTILIKLLFYKLTEKSFVSMAKMRDLQPKMEALKEQYKDDRQALGKATMALYRKEKINPVSGCLPMVVQIPVFIALYYVLAESVQLRMAHFLWIHDLSVKDPYYILPVLMGISMFIQQRLSPPPADPTQAKVMMFLPVFFTIIFLNFPAGLTLYWLTNNTVQVIQQWWVMNKHKKGHYHKKKSKKKK